MPGMPAVVMGDKVQMVPGCVGHQIPSPSGAPIPAPAPLPFGAPLLMQLSTKVKAQGKFVAVQGSNGVNTPPHVGLHASDPFLLPTQQKGQIVSGSSKVYAQGKPVAYTGCQTMTCMAPGMVSGSASKVMVAP